LEEYRSKKITAAKKGNPSQSGDFENKMRAGGTQPRQERERKRGVTITPKKVFAKGQPKKTKEKNDCPKKEKKKQT